MLEPLEERHAADLARIVAPDDDVWRWMAAAPRTEDDFLAWVRARRTPRPGLENLPFLQRHPDGRAMGSTSIFDLDRAAEAAEIGHTWLAAPFRRTGANTEAKYLLLRHGFESLGLRRIQLVTDERNERSRAAIVRIGARFEGILRDHRRGPDGRLRNSAYHSVVAAEWPDVRRRLEARLAGQGE